MAAALVPEPETAPGHGRTVPAVGGAAHVARRLEKERIEGFGRVLKIGAATAALVMLLDGSVFLQTRNESYLIFSMLAALVLVTVVYGFTALQAGKVDRAVAVPLLYVLLVAPVGPYLVPSRALVSIALPFIAMAVAMNYARPRSLRVYVVASWLSAVAVLGFWQFNTLRLMDIPLSFAVANVITASLIVAFALYAMSHYSRRLQRAFSDVGAANEELADAHTELREVDAARVRFMNNAAHELKTPLTPIRIQLQLLKRSPLATDDERAGRSVEILDRNFNRLQRLVGDILDGARMDAGRLEIHRVPLDLTEVLEEAVEEYGRPAEMSGVRLESRIEPDMHILGDGIRIRQVVDNLLTNALKFTRPGGTVRLEALGVGEELCVSVQDDGIGIAPQDLQKLFLPFRQVHDPMRHVTRGSGLGLYISRGIVERHRGRIWAESRGLGGGATFTFCVPRLNEVPEEASPVTAEGPRQETAAEGLRQADQS